jgi:hypothetical protein
VLVRPTWKGLIAISSSGQLTGSATAGGIALINSIGNLSGWLGPFLVGWLKDITGTTSAGLYVVAGLEALATALILLFMPRCAGGARGTSFLSSVLPSARRSRPVQFSSSLRKRRFSSFGRHAIVK